MYIDSHAHFDLILEKTDMSDGELLDDCINNSVSKSVQISIDIESCRWSQDFARKNHKKGILFTLGIHPSSEAGTENLSTLSRFVSDTILTEAYELLFGIGECGLDFYRMRQPKAKQKASFEHQIAIAKEHNLPVIVHSRDAMNETIDILRAMKPGKGIMHCFSGNREAAREILELGFFISFAGNLTYKNARELHESAAYIPLDKMLLETDAPFLSPVPVRGRTNLPAHIRHTYTFLSQLRNETPAAITEQITENFDIIRQG